jgi:hypothetical protein
MKSGHMHALGQTPGLFGRPSAVTPRDVHIDQYLTDILVAYRNLDMIADDVFPIIPVNNQSGLIPMYKQSDWFRRQAALRTSGTRSKRGTFDIDANAQYYCPRYSFGVELDDETIDNADSVWDLEARAIELAGDVLMMERELQLSDKIFTTGKWSQDLEGGTDFTVFSNYGLSTPLPYLAGLSDTIEGRIAKQGNSLLISSLVWTQFRWHPDLIETIKYVERGLITPAIFQSLTGFANIYVGRALYTNDVEGTAEASVTYTRVWGPNALIFYRAPTPTLMDASAGYTFTWRRVPNSLQYALRHRNDEAEVTTYEANSYFTQKLLVPRAGIFLHNVI